MNLMEQIKEMAFVDEVEKIAGPNFAKMVKNFKGNIGRLNEVQLPGGQGVMRSARPAPDVMASLKTSPMRQTRPQSFLPAPRA